MNVINAFIILSIFIFLLSSCDSNQNKQELIIYCGITMVKPISEIAKIIETQENCKIVIIKGGSGNLLNSINYNKNGDLFLPGSSVYYQKENIFIDTAFVGVNRAVLMVQKGNPKGISNNLDNLKSNKYISVIGNPESGSIGQETKKILVKKGIYSQVIINSVRLTTDSKDLVNVLKNKEADVVINWYAVSQWDENKPFIDVLNINSEYASSNRLVLSVLKNTKNEDLATEFLKYAKSNNGKTIFKKYGMY